jgi:formyl-CoA transferase
MKEIAEEKSLRDTGTVVEVDHPTRGKYLTVGNPVKMSDSPCEVKRSPLLGRAHRRGAEEGARYSEKEIARSGCRGAITPPEKPAKAAAA